MIPDKRKDKRSYMELSPEERKKRADKPLSTKAQRLAQQENFALFAIASMYSQLHHVLICDTVKKDNLLQTSIHNIQLELDYLKTAIKCVQSDRKRARVRKEKKRRLQHEC